MATINKISLRRPSPALLSIATMALPLVGVRLVNNGSNFINNILIAQLGPKALAASALAWGLQFSLMALLLASTTAIGICVGNAYGAQDYQQAGKIWRHGMLLVTMMALPVMALLWWVNVFLQAFHQPPPLIDLVQDYCKGYSLAVLPVAWYSATTQMLAGISRARFSFNITLLVLPLTVLMAYGFIFGKGGLPSLGMAGAAYAVTTVYWSMYGFLLLLLFFRQEFEAFQLFHWQEPIQWCLVKRLFHLGWPASLQFGGEFIAILGTTLMMGIFGHTALSAQQMVTQLLSITVVVHFGIAQAVGVHISQAYGAKAYDRLYDYGRMGLYLVSAFTITVGFFFIMYPRFFIHFYINVNDPANVNIVQLATGFFLLTACSQFFDGLRNISTMNLRSLHDPRVPMMWSMLSTWIIGLGGGYLLAHYVQLGPMGYRWSFLLGYALAAVLLIKRFRFKSQALIPLAEGKGFS